MRRDTAGLPPRDTWSAVNRVAARDKPGDVVGRLRDNGAGEEVEVVVAHRERATLRVGDVYLKIDTDQRRTDVEVGAMAMAPVPAPELLWQKPPVLALAALPGTALGRLGEPSDASSAAWAAAGAAARKLHDAPLTPWPGPSLDASTSNLDRECDWPVMNGVLPPPLSHATGGSPRLRSGTGHRHAYTVTCNSPTYSSTAKSSPA